MNLLAIYVVHFCNGIEFPAQEFTAHNTFICIEFSLVWRIRHSCDLIAMSNLIEFSGKISYGSKCKMGIIFFFSLLILCKHISNKLSLQFSISLVFPHSLFTFRSSGWKLNDMKKKKLKLSNFFECFINHKSSVLLLYYRMFICSMLTSFFQQQHD